MIVYMPMVPEAVIAMLACARIGAVHSVVFGGFAANELATPDRGRAAEGRSCPPRAGIEPGRVVAYKPLLDAAIALAQWKPERCIVLQRPMLEAELDPARDLEWHDALAGAEPVDCVPLAATDPLYIIYTSGTTGQPKGIVRDNGGHAVALAWSMKNVYDVEPGEVYWAASDIGWTVGHSYTVYGAAAATAARRVLYEGKPVGTPDAGAFWRVCAEHGVSTLFTAPTAFRAIRQQDPDGEHIGRYDLSRLRALFLAGERCDPETLGWAEEKLGVPVIDHYWQTETGWPVAANCLGIERFPVVPGSPTRAVPGWDVRVLDDERRRSGRRARSARSSSSCRCRPAPRRRSGTRRSATARRTSRRSPATTRPPTPATSTRTATSSSWPAPTTSSTSPGHRLSTGAMEEVLAAHPDVAECAVIGVADALKGQLPLGFVVLKAGVDAAARRDRRARSCSSCASGSARSRRSRPRSSSSACRRRAPGRSCAGRCGGSRTARTYTVPGDDRRPGHPRRGGRRASDDRLPPAGGAGLERLSGA